MPTFKELAQEYADYIRKNFYSPFVTFAVIRKIKELTYTSSGEPLNASDTERLVEEIENLLLQSSFIDRYYHLRADDSRRFIEILDQIKNDLKDDDDE